MLLLWPGQLMDANMTGTRARRRGYAALLTAVVVLVGGAGQSANDPCDPNLQPYGNNGYQLRGDRCEGLFESPVAGGGLAVVSFTSLLTPFDTKARNDVELGWEAPGAGEVRLRAYSLPHLLYYRMDSLQPATAGRYKWPTEMLQVLGLTQQDLGLVAWTGARIGSEEHTVYLPLRVGELQSGSTPSRYEILLHSNKDLTQVFHSLTRLGDEGKQPTVVWQDRSLGKGLYWAYEPVHVAVDMAVDAARGFYQLDLGATLQSGGSDTARVVFWHRGPQ